MYQRKYLRLVVSLLLITLLAFGNNLTSLSMAEEFIELDEQIVKTVLLGEEGEESDAVLEENSDQEIEESRNTQEDAIHEEQEEIETIVEEEELLEEEGFAPLMLSMQSLSEEMIVASIGTPVFIEGNDPDLGEDCETFKVDPPQLGTFGPITITNIYDEGRMFDFVSTVPVSHVFVKGGPNGNLYTYNPKVTGDIGLHAPVNENNGKYYGLSHMTFYFCDTVEPLGRIAGIKFHDLNGDGMLDPIAETGLDGFRIEIHNAYPMTEDTLVAFSETSGGGYFEFDNLPLGTYYVREIQQAGFKQTAPIAPDYFIVEITEDALDVEGLEFGNVAYSSISGHKFHDLNKMNGWDEGEPGIQGWEVALYQLVDEAYVLYVYEEGMGSNPVYTDAAGNYVFENLMPGVYKVVEENRTGWAQSYPAGDGTYTNIEILGGTHLEDLDFGNYIIQYQEETAWATGTPFNAGKNGSWATYFTYSGMDMISRKLMAGQHHEAGVVEVDRNGNELTVTYRTTGDWVLTELHLSVQNTLNQIPQNKSKNPQIGHFKHKHSFDSGVTVHTITVNVAGMSDPIYIAAHAVVKRPIL